MMLSFGVFCFDLVVNKNCSLVIMEKTSISGQTLTFDRRHVFSFWIVSQKKIFLKVFF